MAAVLRGTALGVVLVDQDGVLADFEKGLLAAFRAKCPGAPYVELDDRRGFYAREQYPSQWHPVLEVIMRAEGFYRDLPVIDGAPAALQEIRDAGHEVFVCTSPLTGAPRCVAEKLAWVEHHLGRAWRDRTIITKDKTLVGDRGQPCVLVDDRPDVKGLASPPPWEQVLFDAPYNRGKTGARLSSWADWRKILEPLLAVQRSACD
jgi:5'-nucleotidase